MPGGKSITGTSFDAFAASCRAALDLADLVGVLVDGPAVAGAEHLPQAAQLAEQRIENASVLAQTGARTSGVAPLPNSRSNTTCGLSSIGSGLVRGVGSLSGVGSSIHEIEFV